MRNYLKNNILGIFKKMYEYHDNIRKFIEKKTPVNAKKSLAECKAAAQHISEEIAVSEGENCSAVVCLNEYCAGADEALANIFKETNGNKLRKSLDKLLLKAENSVKNDVRSRIEIAFMPYKASMWDSLESIWKAADEDPDCDAYAVPIPYYDKKHGGSFGELHYEGNEYPEYVPVTHYEEYDLAERRPDIIYIHNPYDEANTVTSVDPRFYSSELKKYTDMLVYVPYFVLGEISPDNEEAVKSIEHFILLPGVVNSDRVIVQSEAMRQIYIDTLLRCFGNTSANRSVFEKKILGLGSPKFDKVLKSNSANCTVIPEKWKKIIYREDGSRRKVVFYNTTIGALLKHNEKWTEKIEEALKTFRESSENIALLWRPHPLIESTMKSMRPDILEKYLEIKEKYIREGWGIFDDTPDLDRAVALSDAYYGDPSSVVSIFEKKSNNVMIQHIP